MATSMNRTAPSTARASAPAAGRVPAPVRPRSSVVAQAARNNDTAPALLSAAAAAVLLLSGPANAATTPVDAMSGGYTSNQAIPAKVVGKDLPKLDKALDAQPTDAVRQAAKDVRDLITDQTNSLNRSVGKGGDFSPPTGPQAAYNVTNAGEKAKQSATSTSNKIGDLLKSAGNKAADKTDDVKQAAGRAQAGDLLKSAGNKVSDKADDIKQAASGNKVGDLLKSAGNKASDKADDIKQAASGNKAGDLLKSAGNKASDKADDVKQAVGEKKKGFFNFFGGSANAKESERKRIGENELKSGVPSASYPNSNQTSPADNPPTTGQKDVFGRNKLVSMRIGENESKSNLPSASYPNSNQTSSNDNIPTLGKKNAFGTTKDYKVTDQVKEAGASATPNLDGAKNLGDKVKDAAKKTGDKAKDLVSMRVGENEQKSGLPSASYPNSNQTSPSSNAPTTGTKDVLGRGRSVTGQLKEAVDKGAALPGAAASGIKDAANRTADKTKELAGKTKSAAKEAVQTNTFTSNRTPAASGLNPGVSEDQKTEQKARGLEANLAQLKSIVGDKLDN